MIPGVERKRDSPRSPPGDSWSREKVLPHPAGISHERDEHRKSLRLREGECLSSPGDGRWERGQPPVTIPFLEGWSEGEGAARNIQKILDAEALQFPTEVRIPAGKWADTEDTCGVLESGGAVHDAPPSHRFRQVQQECPFGNRADP